MNNLQPVSSIDPSDLPEGFTTSDSPLGAPSSSKNENAAVAQRQQEMEAQKQAILEQALTPDALARLRRIKLVKQEKALQVENAIASMALSGKLPGPINEGKLIEMLERGNAAASKNGTGKSISIQRKKYALDSDDEDDNDDDLL